MLGSSFNTRKSSVSVASSVKPASATKRKNESTFNVINGQEKTPQRVTYSKKMYSKQTTNTIIGGEADISDNDDGKSVGRSARVSAPWA